MVRNTMYAIKVRGAVLRVQEQFPGHTAKTIVFIIQNKRENKNGENEVFRYAGGACTGLLH